MDGVSKEMLRGINLTRDECGIRTLMLALFGAFHVSPEQADYAGKESGSAIIHRNPIFSRPKRVYELSDHKGTDNRVLKPSLPRRTYLISRPLARVQGYPRPASNR